MSSGLFIAVLSGLVLIVALLRAAQAIWLDRGIGRGATPGKGDSVIDATYSSGGSGGGEFMSYRIPRDPQAYAKIFIPKDRKK